MSFSKTIKPCMPNQCYETKKNNSEQHFVMDYGDRCGRLLKYHPKSTGQRGIHSVIAMESAGFEYTNNGDTARCHHCKIEVSGWTLDMKPFTIHSQRSPTCPFVLSLLPSHQIITSTMTNAPLTTSAATVQGQPVNKLNADTTTVNSPPIKLVEVDPIKQIRKRTFSHWPHRSSPSPSQMIEAGFFYCNVGDRVICIYCNITCQQWIPNSDDPWEVHKTLSPKCPYVISMLTRSQTSSGLVANDPLTNDRSPISTTMGPFLCDSFVCTAACNTAYIEIPKRYTSFAKWHTENLPSVDDLVKAGFFFTGTKAIVTCFYCNGSMQNWGANDNPTTEHAHWFPHCAYAKQLCGAELYRKIQESKRAQPERAKVNNSNNQLEVNDSISNHDRLLIPDESTLSRLVSARLDLPISQSLVDCQFKLSVIKRCWEDQLRLKHEDFVSDSDLLMACTVLQKQIDHIDGKKENIKVPSMTMKKIREQEQRDARAHEQTASESSLTSSSAGNAVEMATISSPIESSANATTTRTPAIVTEQVDNPSPTSTEFSLESHTNGASIPGPCGSCHGEEWCRALMPCGHFRLQLFSNY